MSNIFLVTGGERADAADDAGILAGVTRAFVLELAAKTGIRAVEETLREEDLADGRRDVLHQHDARDRPGRPRRRSRRRQRQAGPGDAAAARRVRRGAADGLAPVRSRRAQAPAARVAGGSVEVGAELPVHAQEVEAVPGCRRPGRPSTWHIAKLEDRPAVPVAGISRQAPRWVPVTRQYATAFSPWETTCWISTAMSGNAERNA